MLKGTSNPFGKLEAQYRMKLQGYVIEDVQLSPDPEGSSHPQMCLVLLKGGVRKAVFIMADPEGNGPGWIETQEIP